MADYFCESCGDTGTEGTECEHCDQMIVCRDCGGESAIQARKTETDTLRAKLDAAEKELATAWERAGLHLTMISNLQAGLKAAHAELEQVKTQGAFILDGKGAG